MRGEPGHLALSYFTVCEYYDAPKLTVVLQKVGSLIGILLFNVSSCYGLARLVMWAGSL
jgi:flagellar biogenesis protein FliO